MLLQEGKSGKEGKEGEDGEQEEPVEVPEEEPVEVPEEEPVEVPETGECGDDGVPPAGQLSTNLCAGNVANPSQEQIDALAKGCGH